MSARHVLPLVVALLPCLPAATGHPAPAAAAFERFKALAGEWTATDADGTTSRQIYEVVAGGSAVLERCEMTHEGQPVTMLTLYHLDGARLLLTHYCMAGNQPRMEARGVTDGTVAFEFVDATGLDTPGEGHMHRAVFHFEGEDRFTTEWTFHQDGQDTFTEKATYVRAAAR